MLMLPELHLGDIERLFCGFGCRANLGLKGELLLVGLGRLGLHDLNLHGTDLCVDPVVNGRVGIDGARGSLDVGDRVRAVEKSQGARIARNNRASPFFKWRKRLLQTGDVGSLAGQGKGTSKESASKTQDPELKLAQTHSGAPRAGAPTKYIQQRWDRL